MGPLIDDRAVAKMEEHVADALEKGGQASGGRQALELSAARSSSPP